MERSPTAALKCHLPPLGEGVLLSNFSCHLLKFVLEGMGEVGCFPSHVEGRSGCSVLIRTHVFIIASSRRSRVGAGQALEGSQPHRGTTSGFCGFLLFS